ncbi:MAG TPA: hypothetical protein VNK04_01790 [Gemmataceae bacterium]|nr:hypothetical protein [Gemmataceae bacterium]
MKKLLAIAWFSLVVLGLGTDQAHAFGCLGCSRCWYKCCAAQYNAFSPFCCNAVVCKKLFCKKCSHVLDCCPPCPPCPPSCPPVDFCGDHAGIVSVTPPGSAPASGGSTGTAPAPSTGGSAFTPPAPSPVPPGPSTSLPGYPMPYGTPFGMYQPAGYQPYYGYGYSQMPMLNPGYGALMPNALPPAGGMPYYWNTSAPLLGR